jgi:Acyl-CoA thioesterase C-terminal domain
MSKNDRGQSDLRLRQLDFGWWASNGPTAGYLMRLALEALDHNVDTDASVRRIDLHVLRLAAAAPFDVNVSTNPGAAGLNLVTVTFGQIEPFAVASLTLGAAERGTAAGDVEPPAALTLDAYRPMDTRSGHLPPVTSRFVYRPTVEPDGRGPRADWDVVWLTPTDSRLHGRALVASIIDCWYPPSFTRTVREHLRTRQKLEQPKPTTLAAASVSFTASHATYTRAHHVLLANQISAISDGHYFERSEVWSDRGELLATADLLRRHRDRPKFASARSNLSRREDHT